MAEFVFFDTTIRYSRGCLDAMRLIRRDCLTRCSMEINVNPTSKSVFEFGSEIFNLASTGLMRSKSASRLA